MFTAEENEKKLIDYLETYYKVLYVAALMYCHNPIRPNQLNYADVFLPCINILIKLKRKNCSGAIVTGLMHVMPFWAILVPQ